MLEITTRAPSTAINTRTEDNNSLVHIDHIAKIRRPNQYTPIESEEQRELRLSRQAQVSCDLLLAGLYKHHPDHAIAALKGIKPNVIDLEPPTLPELTKLPAEVVPLPTDKMIMAEMIGRRPTIQIIMRVVCGFYGVEAIDVCSDRRDNEIMLPRQIVMYFARKFTTNSTTAIGRIIGGRDHATIIHGARKIKNLIAIGGRVADEIEVIKLHIDAAVLKAA